MAERIEAYVNPAMLVWAREKSGFDINGAAKRLNVKPERLETWEKGEARPSISQAIKMANIYSRPLSSFYLNAPPRDFMVAMTDFRRLPESRESEWSPTLIKEIRHAQWRRQVMLELVDDGEGHFQLLDSISLSDSVSEVAAKVREMLNVTWDSQRTWKETALNKWKQAIERTNVLVFHSSHLGKVLEPSEAHGFSISNTRYPVITVNSGDSKNRRIFTLLHEFAHLLLDTSGVCDTWEFSSIDNLQKRVEVFCNRVAGNVLVPDDLLLNHEVVKEHDQRASRDWPEEEIRNLADSFSTSKEVIVLRLLTLGLTTHAFYEIKRQKYLEDWSRRKERERERRRESKEKPSGPPHSTMMVRNNGKPFTARVLRAYYDREITLSDVSNFLGVKLKHLTNIEKAVAGAILND